MPKKRRPAIDMNNLTEREKRAHDRVLQLGGGLAISQHERHEKILDAVRDSFDDAVAECEDPALIREIFSLFGQTASLSNAKTIATHPDCPADVRAEIAARVEENNRRLATARKAREAKRNGASAQ
ncbi:hypothetical protein [Aliiruegeria sabulilitoris]|uniref:hypothetical protein n=1 Tax=Aliiruegeria sabulilitoris TaxID=1510458 RepID=UPI000836C417|nr:hypothetical protein [Aliiruegeria sabulilitoris]NDR57304.1 hypothetical protein [Pseudoruegeria sp. M32A2M]